jgi:hypothetical protein
MPKAIDSTGQLVAVIVERSQPDLERVPPRGVKEEVLRDLDRRSAQCYADLELKSHRLRKLASAIEETDAGEDTTPVEADVDEDSLVVHITGAMKALRAEGSE